MEDVKEMLFDKDQTLFNNPYYGDNRNTSGYSVDQVAETVWNDICGQEMNNFKQATEMIESGHIDDPNAPDYNDFEHIKDNNQKWDMLDDASRKFVDKKMKEIFNLRKLKLKKINNEKVDTTFYCFEYSDNDGEYGSTLEHGDLFHKLKHLKISNH